MTNNALGKSIQTVKLTAATTDLVDIISERNRRAGHGPTKRADVVRDAVRGFYEKEIRAIAPG